MNDLRRERGPESIQHRQHINDLLCNRAADGAES
jgi:hypothetical protein